MPDKDYQRRWRGMPNRLPRPRGSDDPAQGIPPSSSSYVGFQPLSLTASNIPANLGSHEGPAFSYPVGQSTALLQQYQCNYWNDQGQQNGINKRSVTLPQEAHRLRILELEAEYATYETGMKEIFQNVINGRLVQAGESLLHASTWLLEHVEEVGLHKDENSLYGARIQLWGEFNTAWLSLFRRQTDMLESGRQVQHEQSLMTQAFINKMVNDLIEGCNAIQEHGLVDYQYGVEEELIITAVEECLDLQERIEGFTERGEP